jgi:branched-chain amino acid transport system substrate-binding protein
MRFFGRRLIGGLSLSALAAFCLVAAAQSATAQDGLCGPGTGKKATGAPILIGSVVGQTGPDDFSAGARAARAYFNCINGNGGIKGRPIEYLVEDDQWNPEVAGQVASKLVKDKGVVALVANGSFVDMTVNAKLYEQEGVAVIAAACAVRECFEAKNIASTNQGPVPSNITAVQWAVKNLGTKKIACIALNIPSNGVWACDITDNWMKEHGLVGVPVLFDPASADLTSVMLEAAATGADTMLVSLPAGLGVDVMKVAQEQNMRDKFKWITPTPFYKVGVPEALGAYWSGKVHVSIELTPWNNGGPDNKRWLAVMDKYGKKEDARDTFSQAGFVSANILVAALSTLDADKIDRKTATAAIKAVKNFRTDLLCNPWYFGAGDRHQPNHASVMVVIKSTGFEEEAACFNAEGKYFDSIFALEKEHHLVGN